MIRAYLTSLLLSCLAVFTPIKTVLVTVLVLVLSDLILGVWAALKRGEKVSSYGIRRTITKLFVYQVAICLGFLAQTNLLGNGIPVINILAGLAGLAELKSIMENLNIISGQDLLRGLLDRLQGPETK